MARPDKIREMWNIEKELGIRPEDFYGDEHFHPDSDIMARRKSREGKLEEFTGESWGLVIYDPKKEEIYTINIRDLSPTKSAKNTTMENNYLKYKPIKKTYNFK